MIWRRKKFEESAIGRWSIDITQSQDPTYRSRKAIHSRTSGCFGPFARTY
jgi:hypothetical protein